MSAETPPLARSWRGTKRTPSSRRATASRSSRARSSRSSARTRTVSLWKRTPVSPVRRDSIAAALARSSNCVGVAPSSPTIATPIQHVSLNCRPSSSCDAWIASRTASMRDFDDVAVGALDDERDHVLAELSEQLALRGFGVGRRNPLERGAHHAIRDAAADRLGDAGQAVDVQHGHRERSLLQSGAREAIAKLPREAAPLEPRPALDAGFVGRVVGVLLQRRAQRADQRDPAPAA